MRKVADSFPVEDDATQKNDSEEGSSVNAGWPLETPAEAKAQDTGYDEDKRDTSVRKEKPPNCKLCLVHDYVKPIIDVVLGPRSHHPLHPLVLGRQWEHLQGEVSVGQGGRTQGSLVEDYPLVAVAVRTKAHPALVALKGEVGEVHVTSQLRDNVEVLADCNLAGVFKRMHGYVQVQRGKAEFNS